MRFVFITRNYSKEFKNKSLVTNENECFILIENSDFRRISQKELEKKVNQGQFQRVAQTCKMCQED